MTEKQKRIGPEAIALQMLTEAGVKGYDEPAEAAPVPAATLERRRQRPNADLTSRIRDVMEMGEEHTDAPPSGAVPSGSQLDVTALTQEQIEEIGNRLLDEEMRRRDNGSWAGHEVYPAPVTEEEPEPDDEPDWDEAA